MSDDILTGLNSIQQKAVTEENVPLLVLAGAGSGKTKVLTHRIAHLLQNGVFPWEILAVTFTNKAAKEMNMRIKKMVRTNADKIWIGTFHSIALRIIKENHHKAGVEKNFTIADKDAQKTIIKKILKDLGWDETYKPAVILDAISKLKGKLYTTGHTLTVAKNNHERDIAHLYGQYQDKLKQINSLDFDDLIVMTIRLFQNHQDVCKRYQSKFKHILVDEYQDINNSQRTLIKLLVGQAGIPFVVGDDNQSIYAFRGANIDHILEFEKDFANAKCIKLEQNYRSVKNILLAANAVIDHNESRLDKQLWTENKTGEPVSVFQANSNEEEAKFIAKRILQHMLDGRKAKDFAILYRTNAQSRMLEQELLANGIAYKIIRGLSFYERAEIKDLISYLQVIYNRKNSIALERIINTPTRGIGKTLKNKLTQQDTSLYDALQNSCGSFTNSNNLKLKDFLTILQTLQDLQYDTVAEIILQIIKLTAYEDHINKQDNSKERLANIQELINFASSHNKLEDFLETISLTSDSDAIDDKATKVSLMTVHTSKGLEFPVVFVAGMEQGIFPHINCMDSDKELEEERRLCYVAITRAEHKLYLTYCTRRMQNGRFYAQAPSMFLSEIPDNLLLKEDFYHGQS